MRASPDSMAIVLAAGKGTRMESELPKVLVPVCGRPMVCYVLDALAAAGISRMVVVVGYRSDQVRQALASVPNLEFAEQAQQLGTGHAVMTCRDPIAEHQGPVVVVAGDSPMLEAKSVQTLVETCTRERAACVLGTVERDDPAGYGRIVRDAEGAFTGIVEEKDASAQQRAIREVNVSTYVFDAGELLAALSKLERKNAQGEYYLTDCPTLLLADGKRVTAHKVLQPGEALSINSKADLRAVEEAMGSAGAKQAHGSLRRE